jgi:hypothetical protein
MILGLVFFLSKRSGLRFYFCCMNYFPLFFEVHFMSNTEGEKNNDEIEVLTEKIRQIVMSSHSLFDDLIGPSGKARAESELSRWREAFHDASYVCDFFQKKIEILEAKSEAAFSEGDIYTWAKSMKKVRSLEKKLRRAQKDFRDAGKIMRGFEDILARFDSR